MIEVLKVNSKNFKKIIQIAAESIKEGKVLICPTDTVYGLVADATNQKAVKKLFRIKKRKKEKAVPIFVKDIKTAKKLAGIDKTTEKFLRKVWFTRPNFRKAAQKEIVKISPKIWAGKGKVTVILKKQKRVKIFGVDKKTIGLRIPNYKLVNILLSKINRPLTGTSANISGKPASTKIKEVINQLKEEKPDLILNAGDLKKSFPSTVLDLTKKKPKILRKGEKIIKIICPVVKIRLLPGSKIKTKF